MKTMHEKGDSIKALAQTKREKYIDKTSNIESIKRNFKIQLKCFIVCIRTMIACLHRMEIISPYAVGIVRE